jgi:hypothetical protein
MLSSGGQEVHTLPQAILTKPADASVTDALRAVIQARNS